MRPRQALARAALLWLPSIATLLATMVFGQDVAFSQGAALVERAEAVGVDFVHQDGASGRLLLPEIMGPGVALLDYDRDGDLDLYLVQSGQLIEHHSAKGAGEIAPLVQLAPERRQAADRLYRNDLRLDSAGESRLRFSDATDEAGLAATGYGQGVAVGDVDGNGWPDLYLTNVGGNQLWVNQEGRFRRRPSGAEDPRWSTSASFFDADGDGDLDLFVANYAVWSAGSTARCIATNSRRDYCGPSAYPPERDGFYLNQGDGTFRSSLEPMLAAAPGAGLGVVAFDANGDGLLDVFVANDGMVNRLWLNESTSDAVRFSDDGLLSGVAVNREGQPEASMGVALGDVDEDTDPDVFLTHLDGETDTLLINDGSGLFVDQTAAAGVARVGRARTSFGTVLADLDGDLLQDLVVVSGAVRLESARGLGGSEGLGQPNSVLGNTGVSGAGSARRVGFELWDQARAPGFSEPNVSRGLAVGDLDNDGDLDLVVGNAAGPTEVYLNTLDPSSWVGVTGLPDGSSVHLVLSNGRRLVRWSRRDGSYLSSSDPRVVAPLPEGVVVERVEVFSLGGAEPRVIPEPKCCQYLELGEGAP